MRKMSILVVGAALVLCATLALAGPRGRGMGPGGGYGWGPGMGYTATPDLTPDQSAQIKAQQEAFLLEITPLQNRLLSKKAELRLLWAETEPDRGKILAKQKEMNEIWTQMEEKAIIYRIDSQAILTPEQRAKIVGFGPGSDGGFGRGWGKHGRW